MAFLKPICKGGVLQRAVLSQLGRCAAAQEVQVLGDSASEYGRTIPSKSRWNLDLCVRSITTQGATCGEAARIVEEHVTMKDAPADQPFSVLGLNHVAIAVPDLEAASEMYRSVFGACVSQPKPEPSHGVTVVFVKLPGLCIELLHPLGHGSPIKKFLQKSPRGGLHHLCLTVDNIHRAAQHLAESNVHMLGDGKPKIGAHGDPVVFVNPKDTNGVLIELEEASGSLHETKHEKW